MATLAVKPTQVHKSVLKLGGLHTEGSLVLTAKNWRSEVQSFSSDLQLERRELAYVLSISQSTLRRRLSGEKSFTGEESEHITELNALAALAGEVLESVANVRRWIRIDNVALGGRSPLELLNTHRGIEDVRTVLGHIEFGIYS